MPELFSRAQLEADGWTRHGIDAAVVSDQLRKLRRGYYSPTTAITSPRIHATSLASSPAAVISHSSAAWLHGLPVRRDSLDHVHLTRSRRGGGRVHPGIHVYACPIRDDEVAEIDGLHVTSLPRTIIDVGRHEPLPWAIAAGDAALHNRLATVDELNWQLNLAARRPGIRKARRTVGFLSPLAESPGESISRWELAMAGLPAPELQVWLPCWDSEARVDFFWEEYGVVGEFDGAVKYGVDLAGPDPTKALSAEKRRDDGLRAHGYTVIHWTWDDLWVPARLAHMIRTGIATAQQPRARRSA